MELSRGKVIRSKSPKKRNVTIERKLGESSKTWTPDSRTEKGSSGIETRNIGIVRSRGHRERFSKGIDFVGEGIRRIRGRRKSFKQSIKKGKRK